MARLTPDRWRRSVGFSADIDVANTVLFSAETTDPEIIETIGQWLQQNQPCLFGRIAAKLGFIRYCILRESDLSLSDEAIAQKIQHARRRWLKDAFEGKTSNFVIIVISPTISEAVPDQVVAKIAQRLCSLYLRLDATFDSIHHENIFLEKPGHSKMTWRWLAGVNYFSSQGDKRWWHDHRFPGGMAFSVNSVGHFVRSEKIANAMIELNKSLGVPDEEGWSDSRVDSLEKALVMAMRTISLAADTSSGKATELLSQPTSPRESKLKCPVELPKSLSEKNCIEYLGYYHTDYTLPSEYFLADVERSISAEPFFLDFTYLFHKHVANPDFFTVGEGQRIRAEHSGLDQSSTSQSEGYKMRRGVPESIPIESSQVLLEALGIETKTV
jgi:hypothetical protein